MGTKSTMLPPRGIHQLKLATRSVTVKAQPDISVEVEGLLTIIKVGDVQRIMPKYILDESGYPAGSGRRRAEAYRGGICSRRRALSPMNTAMPISTGMVNPSIHERRRSLRGRRNSSSCSGGMDYFLLRVSRLEGQCGLHKFAEQRMWLRCARLQFGVKTDRRQTTGGLESPSSPRVFHREKFLKRPMPCVSSAARKSLFTS